jgi:Uma2 family endonuclease
MDTPVLQSSVTLDALLRLFAQDKRYEVINGALVEMTPVGGMHVFVVDNTADLIKPNVREHKSGYFFSDGLIYLLDGDPKTLRGTRVPDLSFVRKENIPKDWDIRLPFPGKPDLAIEVVSPGEGAQDVLSKIRDFFRAGTEEVWVLYPDSRELHQHQRDKSTVQVYREDNLFDASTFFPGLIIPIAALFVVPELGE